MDAPKDSEILELREEITLLRREVRRLNDHRFIRVQNSMPRMLTFQLLRGLALGLGTVIGASALVSVLAFALAQVDFLPIIGDWAADFAEQIEGEMRARQDTEAVVDPADGSADRAADQEGNRPVAPEGSEPEPSEGRGGSQ